jgi:hypothetical protein
MDTLYLWAGCPSLTLASQCLDFSSSLPQGPRLPMVMGRQMCSYIHLSTLPTLMASDTFVPCHQVAIMEIDPCRRRGVLMRVCVCDIREH